MNNTNYNHKQNMVLVTKPWLICDLNNYNNHVFCFIRSKTMVNFRKGFSSVYKSRLILFISGE